MNRRVVLYVLPGCDRCESARLWLSHEGVRFSEVNVLAQPRKARHITLGCIPPYPVLEVDGDVFTGADTNRLSSIFASPASPEVPVR
ncbi:MAG: hypothetical protein H7A45_03650 [Verrucomicrobiales bacterium]|nr:hypothetical protein [Verrucomicrobiales bacterium]